MYQQPSKVEGRLHLKVAIISVLIATVILGLAVAIVVIATTRSSDEDNSNDTTTVVDNGAEESNKATTVSSDSVAGEVNTSTNNDSPYASSKKSNSTTSGVKDLPKTGPENLLPMMLMGGMMVAYATSSLKARRR